MLLENVTYGDNVTINDKHPRRVVFSYGDGQEGSMTMALDEPVVSLTLKVNSIPSALPEDD